MKHICGHQWRRYCLPINQVMIGNVKFLTWWVRFNHKEPYFKEILIETTSFAISCYLTYIYSIYMCSWNVATYKWTVHKGNNCSHFICYVSLLTDSHYQFLGDLIQMWILKNSKGYIGVHEIKASHLLPNHYIIWLLYP